MTMVMMLMCCEDVIENEIAQGLKQKDVAMTYAMAMHSHDHGRETDWRRINEAIISKWSRRGLERVKKMAHGIYERRGQPVN
jgi:hypothetical protein